MPFLENDPLTLVYWNGTVWQLATSLTYIINDSTVATAPKGFATDLASVPQLFWNILPPTGGSWDLYGPATVIHDYLYKYAHIYNYKTKQIQSITQLQADLILFQAMTDLGCPTWSKYLVYYGVRFGGFSAWNKWRKLNLQENSSDPQYVS